MISWILLIDAHLIFLSQHFNLPLYLKSENLIVFFPHVATLFWAPVNLSYWTLPPTSFTTSVPQNSIPLYSLTPRIQPNPPANLVNMQKQCSSYRSPSPSMHLSATKSPSPLHNSPLSPFNLPLHFSFASIDLLDLSASLAVHRLILNSAPRSYGSTPPRSSELASLAYLTF